MVVEFRAKIPKEIDVIRREGWHRSASNKVIKIRGKADLDQGVEDSKRLQVSNEDIGI
jgi:hypothetical protein